MGRVTTDGAMRLGFEPAAVITTIRNDWFRLCLVGADLTIRTITGGGGGVKEPDGDPPSVTVT